MQMMANSNYIIINTIFICIILCLDYNINKILHNIKRVLLDIIIINIQWIFWLSLFGLVYYYTEKQTN